MIPSYGRPLPLLGNSMQVCIWTITYQLNTSKINVIFQWKETACCTPGLLLMPQMKVLLKTWSNKHSMMVLNWALKSGRERSALLWYLEVGQTDFCWAVFMCVCVCVCTCMHCQTEGIGGRSERWTSTQRKWLLHDAAYQKHGVKLNTMLKSKRSFTTIFLNYVNVINLELL